MSVPAPTAPDPRPSIPDKLYFRIGEAAKLAGIEAYVLRYWETEFPKLAPRKSGAGQRLYRRKDVEMILELKHLLYEKRFTIEGARLYLEQSRKKGARTAPAPIPIQQTSLFGPPDPPKLDDIKRELRAIVALLK